MLLDNVIMGFQTALSLENLMYSFIGVFVGNLIGVLPGIGALAAISMLLPITYGLEPSGALMMLAGLYYGTSYGGATTTILLNLPGTPTHAVVCLDGHPMARQGAAGPACPLQCLALFFGAPTGFIFFRCLVPWWLELPFRLGRPSIFPWLSWVLLPSS